MGYRHKRKRNLLGYKSGVGKVRRIKKALAVFLASFKGVNHA